MNVGLYKIDRMFTFGRDAMMLIAEIGTTVTIVFNCDEDGVWTNIGEIILKSGEETLFRYCVEGMRKRRGFQPNTVVEAKPFVAQRAFYKCVEASLDYLGRLVNETEDESMRRNLQVILGKYSLIQFESLNQNSARVLTK